MTARPAPADHFRSLHGGPEILLMPNAWDVGSARILQHLGFRALATTSSGSAAAQGRLDGELGREAALAHVGELAAAVQVPVSADLENCFADEPEGVGQTIESAAGTGIAGASVEDWSGSEIYGLDQATERVRAAVDGAVGRLVITARAENHIHGVDDLEDTITRLQSYEKAGADVLFAPGLRSGDEIRLVLENITAPLSVLAMPGVPPVHELAELGVRRVSVGGAFAFTAYAALLDAGRELLEGGTYGYLKAAGQGSQVARAAFS
jgi:2-methylisocitrate lyase-like PEP mutase family enzyme